MAVPLDIKGTKDRIVWCNFVFYWEPNLFCSVLLASHTSFSQCDRAHCQFEKKSSSDNTPEESHSTCVLQCKNGGHCRKGSKNDAHVQDLLSKYSSELGHMGLNISHSKDVEHCACPDGFVGLECEYSMTTCGDHGSAHPCFAGSECTIVNNVPTCVCDDADTASAGIYCQHKPSDVCEKSNKEVNGNRGFCTNGGVCATDVSG